MIESDRKVESAARGIDVHHLDVFPTGPGARSSQWMATVISLKDTVASRVAALGSNARTRRRRVTGAGTRAASR